MQVVHFHLLTAKVVEIGLLTCRLDDAATFIHSFHNPKYTTRGSFGHKKECAHARNEHMDPLAGRRNILYESSPAGTMVDGSPRVASYAT